MRVRILIPAMMAAALAIAIPAAPSFADEAATAPTTAPATAPATETVSLKGKLEIPSPEKATITIVHQKAMAKGHEPPKTDNDSIQVHANADGTYEAKNLVPGYYFILVTSQGPPIAKMENVKVEKDKTTTLNIKPNMNMPPHYQGR